MLQSGLELITMQEDKTQSITAAALLDLLTDVLADDAGSQSRLRADYGKFRTRVDDSDARMLAAVKFLKDLSSRRSPRARS